MPGGDAGDPRGAAGAGAADRGSRRAGPATLAADGDRRAGGARRRRGRRRGALDPDLRARAGGARRGGGLRAARLGRRGGGDAAAAVPAMGAARVVPPPGAFLQATAEGERGAGRGGARGGGRGAAGRRPLRRLRHLLAAAGGSAPRCWRWRATPAMPAALARGGAADARAPAGQDARRATSSAGRCSRQELAGFEAVVIDPPRAGRRGAEPGAGALGRAGDRRGLLRSGELRPRRGDPRGGRLPAGLGAARRPVPLVGARGAGGAASAAEAHFGKRKVTTARAPQPSGPNSGDSAQ